MPLVAVRGYFIGFFRGVRAIVIFQPLISGLIQCRFDIEIRVKRSQQILELCAPKFGCVQVLPGQRGPIGWALETACLSGLGAIRTRVIRCAASHTPALPLLTVDTSPDCHGGRAF